MRRGVRIAGDRVNWDSRYRERNAEAARGTRGRGEGMDETRIVIITGDLVEQEVDAIVNAANNDLQLGAGVAGAIRRAGGPTIQDECDVHGPVKVGEAAITGAGNLRARFVIHAASMSLGGRTTRSYLRYFMDDTFRIACEYDASSIAVPAVGTGIAGFPIDDCARVMAESLKDALSHGWEPQ